jgi:hypothetical protein
VVELLSGKQVEVLKVLQGRVWIMYRGMVCGRALIATRGSLHSRATPASPRRDVEQEAGVNVTVSQTWSRALLRPLTHTLP